MEAWSLDEIVHLLLHSVFFEVTAENQANYGAFWYCWNVVCLVNYVSVILDLSVMVPSKNLDHTLGINVVLV